MRMTIIAVDDERPALWMLKGAIEEAVEVTPACFHIAEEALAFARQTPVDVAFLDIEMGTVSGLFLAKALKEIRPETNIVFVTGHRHYSMNAFQLHASGYVMKPINPERVRVEMQHLRQPPRRLDRGFRVQCFGSFEVFMDGSPIQFSRPKAKEVLAYLVDRKGESVTKKQLAGVLWEDKPYSHSVQSHVYLLVAELERALLHAGAPDILVQRRGQYSVDLSKFDCDYYAYCRGDAAAVNAYRGEYMANYSWAEFTAGFLARGE